MYIDVHYAYNNCTQYPGELRVKHLEILLFSWSWFLANLIKRQYLMFHRAHASKGESLPLGILDSWVYGLGIPRTSIGVIASHCRALLRASAKLQ
jgi:hypothetical protein